MNFKEFILESHLKEFKLKHIEKLFSSIKKDIDWYKCKKTELTYVDKDTKGTVESLEIKEDGSLRLRVEIHLPVKGDPDYDEYAVLVTGTKQKDIAEFFSKNEPTTEEYKKIADSIYDYFIDNELLSYDAMRDHASSIADEKSYQSDMNRLRRPE